MFGWNAGSPGNADTDVISDILPGVAPDGLVPAGFTVQGNLKSNVGLSTRPTVETGNDGFGVLVDSADAQVINGCNSLTLRQQVSSNGVFDGGGYLLHVKRYDNSPSGNHAYAGAAIRVEDYTNNGTPSIEILTSGATVFSTPALPSSITGALSSVVDPAAKAILTAIISALTSYHMATDGTT